MLMAFSVRQVRPVVSMKVRWREMSALTRGTVVLYWTFLWIGVSGWTRKRPAEIKNVLGSFGENDAELDVLIRHSFRLFWPFEERHVEDVTVARLEPSQKLLDVGVPANAEGVVPSAEDGVPRLDGQERLALVAPEPRGRDVANHVSVVRRQTPHPQREGELCDGRRRRAVVCLRDPLHPRELLGEVRGAVVQGVSILERNVAAPVADLDIAFQAGDVDQWLGELVPDRHRLHRTRWELGEGAIGELGALLLGRLLTAVGSGENCILRHEGSGELDLGLLLLRHVRRRAVGGEAVDQELAVLLRNGGGARGERGQVGVGNAEGLLCLGRERCRETDAVELRVTARPVSWRSPSRWARVGVDADLAGSYSTASTTKRPPSGFFLSLTSIAPIVSIWREVKGR